MKKQLLVTMSIFFVMFSLARGDQAIASVQQKLKDQGFYYGEINGQKDADTLAAIRRYQIRNGLKITGELDTETQRSLRVTVASSAPATSRASATPVPKPSGGYAERRAPVAPTDPEDSEEPPAYAPGPRELRAETTGIFDGTPFEIAPPDVQHRAIMGVQTILSQRGYYRSGIDGAYGPGTEFAVRAFQARVGIAPSGRLDLETLAALGLLPGQRSPGFGPSRHRIYRPRPRLDPFGERIYLPN
ncbi:MAG: peptidoglycan-binding domain-containing protein [Verrucomicrobiota bacterium]